MLYNLYRCNSLRCISINIYLYLYSEILFSSRKQIWLQYPNKNKMKCPSRYFYKIQLPNENYLLLMRKVMEKLQSGNNSDTTCY